MCSTTRLDWKIKTENFNILMEKRKWKNWDYIRCFGIYFLETVLVSSQINVWGNWFKAAINTNKWIFDRKNRKLETHSSKIEEISRLLSIMSDLPSSSLSSFRFSSKAINDFQTVKNEFSGKRLRLDVTSNDWSIYSDKKLDSYGENYVIETN